MTGTPYQCMWHQLVSTKKNMMPLEKVKDESTHHSYHHILQLPTIIKTIECMSWIVDMALCSNSLCVTDGQWLVGMSRSRSSDRTRYWVFKVNRDRPISFSFMADTYLSIHILFYIYIYIYIHVEIALNERYNFARWAHSCVTRLLS